MIRVTIIICLSNIPHHLGWVKIVNERVSRGGIMISDGGGRKTRRRTCVRKGHDVYFDKAPKTERLGRLALEEEMT